MKYRFLAVGADGFPPPGSPEEEIPPKPSVYYPEGDRELQFGPPGDFPPGVYETDSDAEARFLRDRGFISVDEKGGPAFDPKELPKNMLEKWNELNDKLKAEWLPKGLDFVKGVLTGMIDHARIAQVAGGEGHQCRHPGCELRFPTPQARNAHERVHKNQ